MRSFEAEMEDKLNIAMLGGAVIIDTTFCTVQH